MHGITKRLVESTIAHVNVQAEQLGWARRYEFVAGSNANGVKHLVQTILPDLDHPTDQERFATLAKVYLHLSVISKTLKDAKAERDRARNVAVNGGVPRMVERRNQTDEPEMVDPRNQAG